MKKFIKRRTLYYCLLAFTIIVIFPGPVDWLKDKSESAIETLEKTAKTGGVAVKKTVEMGIEHIKSFTSDLLDIFNKFSTKEVRKQINEKNNFKDKVGKIKQEAEISPNEKSFLNNRSKITQNALENFFGHKFTKEQFFNVGLVATGGGYRAMIATAGFVKGLEESGLLDTISYFSTLSGSTWFLAPWIMSSGSANTYLQKLINSAKRKILDLTRVQTLMAADIRTVINDIIWPKFIFDQPIGSVDLYGVLLAYVLFNDLGPQRQRILLTDQYDKIKEGSKPWPIYTAISMHKLNGDYIYNWYEFNPVEVVNLEINGKPEAGQKLYKFDTFAFGSKFNVGSTQEIAPPQSMGYILGFSGSAYNVNLKDLYRIIFEDSDLTRSGIDKVKFDVARKIFEIAQNIKGIGKARLLPAQVNNPFLNLPGIPEWLSKRNYLVFVDAGIDYNLPIRPLLLKNRNIRVIFVCDSSSTIDPALEVPKMFEDIKRVYNYNYSRVDDKSNKSLHLYKDEKNKQAPLIVYLNYIKDEKLIENAQKDPSLKKIIDENNLGAFDALKCLKQEYCSTFNFEYKVNDLKQLAGIAEFNVKANANTIKEFLKKELKF